ncbi:MAG: TetR/AcrR family transcriptional regulator, partial [Gammaproteobacteria bacterium]|nr:TetR/AcrR family transcriptional regulator [Gammaproteobacteria bacterium]
MAQKSKKDHIIKSALALFLENGFKGTSIDMVVRVSKVSKATVYNHFPDKSALMLAVLSQWIDANKPLIAPLKDSAELDEFLRRHWLTDEAVRFYALVIGEGWRFPQAKRLFWDQFDHLWRKALGYASTSIDGFELASLEQRLDHQLLARL